MRSAVYSPWLLVVGICALILEQAASLAVHTRREVLDQDINAILTPDAAPFLDYRDPNSLLAQILIPRAPGTENSTLVREALISRLRQQKDSDGKDKWHITTHSFEANTPEGARTMTNIIATRDPNAEQYLVLAAHYDSKYFPPGPMHGFIGATDSAAPCAMLIDVACALDRQLDAHTAKMMEQRSNYSTTEASRDVSLQLIFFDGEEAYRAWSDTDSIYGARQLAVSLASSWSQPDHALARRHTTGRGLPVRSIQKIQCLVLLDLLGAPNVHVPYYFENTKWMHQSLQRIESRLLAKQSLYPDKHRKKQEPIFVPLKGPTGIGDDHLPFLREGVPILHLIPSPFPAVWHGLADDASALDYATLFAFSKVMRVFTAEVLELDAS
ncbi:glutaminyl-peptide cyclotransferase [Malassezia yamatoensis]|uniref:Peptide hydrolase n=1 Tax=Malassezia yamatoensis TaxID=253288 RepID=A0AAJ5YRL0_9BASI|nr:glutaminyl-peptide cyclotransferase [Malassezia yamatoensis]